MAMDRPIEDDSSPASGPWTDRVRAISATRRDQLVVIGVALLAHGWLVVNNGIYWDDWLVYAKLQRGDLAGVQQLASQVGGIPTYLYIWIAAAALPPAAIGFKILALLLIAGSGLLMYSICRESELVSRAEAVLIACLAIAYPADHTRVLLVTVNYLAYWFAFLLGVLLLTRSEAATGRAKWVLRVLRAGCISVQLRTQLASGFLFRCAAVRRPLSLAPQGIAPYPALSLKSCPGALTCCSPHSRSGLSTGRTSHPTAFTASTTSST